ncbi:carotenoid biosynthesis protein [Marivirga sp. S37H4]|uniref:Carotenoid biosynthesis protein n=1 Tax=Marivirga aurantiaca TaxID=2802615 RepID=A0A935CDG1_9BACT|nr:carotenoid biosynthesis protein [Marivirga aurantiaca]MBK6266878.1 carotenoid biosynthesis protein [Marivirga aurantiaca]
MYSKLTNTLQFIQSRPAIGIVILSAFYFFGIIGIQSEAAKWFIEKTAFNLLLSLVILLTYQQTFNFRLWIGFLFCYFIGFFAEYLGVTYGILFGSYEYPDTLGIQWNGVPVIIGVNWFLLTFCIWALMRKTSFSPAFLIIPATILTVLVDILIEPVAISLNFWQWENNTVPLQNYVGWGFISFLIFSFYALIRIPTDNKIYWALLAWQIIFFASLNFLL